MPDPSTIERFVDLVERNLHVEAIEAFYAPHATMSENGAPPRVGRDALVAHERATLARAAAVRSRCVRPVLVSGDTTVVRWVFEFDGRDGRTTRLEELAWQRWEGERIVEETFFYDPAQLRAGRAS